MLNLLKNLLVAAGFLLGLSAPSFGEVQNHAATAEEIAAQALAVIKPQATEAPQGGAAQDASKTGEQGGAPAVVAPVVMTLPMPEAIEEDVNPPGPEFAKIRPQARSTDYASVQAAYLGKIRPRSRPYILPKTRWEHRPGNKAWTRAAMMAVLSHGKPLVQTVPSDYKTWCPAYRENDEYRRAMFWVGFMSALAKHESTYRQDAVGGGGLWYGLLQILPSTARLYKCKAKTGQALKNGADNLTCATRIMTKTVGRDKIIHGFFPGTKHKYRGITQDWGPMHSSSKRNEMSAWTRKQSYCVSRRSLRPKLRPAGLAQQSLPESEDA